MIIDIAVIAILLISAGIAFFRGLIREVLTILGVLGGLVAAYYGGEHLVPIISGWLGIEDTEDPQKLFDLVPYTAIAAALAYGSIFILVVIILSVFSHMLSGWARAIGLGAIDRTLGVIFGIARGVLILALLYLPVFMMTPEETRDGWFEGSKTRIYIEATAKWMAGFIPEDVTENMSEKAEETSESVAKATREKMEDMDILDGLKEKVRKDSEDKQKDDGTVGYERGERLDMQQLFNDAQDAESPEKPQDTDSSGDNSASEK